MDESYWKTREGFAEPRCRCEQRRSMDRTTSTLAKAYLFIVYYIDYTSVAGTSGAATELDYYA